MSECSHQQVSILTFSLQFHGPLWPISCHHEFAFAASFLTAVTAGISHRLWVKHHLWSKHTKVLGLCQQPSFLSNLLSFWEAIHQKILVSGGFNSQNLGCVRWVHSQSEEFYGSSPNQMKHRLITDFGSPNIGNVPNIQCPFPCQASACSRMINVNL